MPLKSFVDDARKTNTLIDQLKVQQKNLDGKIIDISEGQSIPQEKLDEIKEQNKSTLPSQYRERAIPQRKDYTSFEREYIKKKDTFGSSIAKSTGNSTQKIDERHNNIISTIIKQNGNCPKGNTTWENCKHLKKDGSVEYCREFMSLCGKEKCKRATK